MADQRYPVSIGQGENAKQYSEAYQTQPGYAVQWKGILQKAHGQALVRCLCPGKGTRRLAVRHRSEQDSFHLSRYPHTGAEHALDCLYYSPDPDKSGLGAYSKGVVEETKDGDLKIKLTLSLRKKDPAENQPMEGTSPAPSSSKPSKPAMTLCGLLHLLWSEAGLNQWVPGMAGKRGLGLIHSRLQHAADRMLASRMRIGDALLIATSSAGLQADANSQKVASAIRNKRRLIVVAPLAAHSEEREHAMSGYLAIAGFHGVPRLLMDEELWQRTARSYAAALRGWREGRRVIAIVQTDQPTVPSKAQALNVALMVVSDEWIPVESGYEAVIEALLRDQGRRFIKPMRFDADQEQVFPDFWLMDVGAGRELPMEVYGRQDPKYLARKEVKCAYYTRHYGPTGWWSWDASADPRGLSIPAFPRLGTPKMTTIDWALYDCKLGQIKDVELARLIGSTPHRVRRRREQLGIPPWSVGKKIEPFKDLLGFVADSSIAARCGVDAKSVKAYRESLGILPFFRPAPRKQVLPIGHDLRPYKPLFGYVSDQEIAQLAGVDLDLVQDVREGLGFEPIPPLLGSATPDPVPDFHGPLLGYESLFATMTPTEISRKTGVPYPVIMQRCAFLGIQPYKRVSVASRYDHLLGKVPDALVAKLAGVSRASIGARRKRLSAQAKAEL